MSSIPSLIQDLLGNQSDISLAGTDDTLTLTIPLTNMSENDRVRIRQLLSQHSNSPQLDEPGEAKGEVSSEEDIIPTWSSSRRRKLRQNSSSSEVNVSPYFIEDGVQSSIAQPTEDTEAPQPKRARTTIETDENGVRRLTIKDLNPDSPELPADNSIPSGTVLSSLHQQLSNKALHALYPTVWTKNGNFTTQYTYLQPDTTPIRDRTIPNKDGLTWCILYGRVFQCNPVKTPIGWTRAIISFVRSSNVSPTYGRVGMAQRAAAAAEA